MKLVDPPEWDDDLFDGMGGYVGETEHITYMCSVEYEQIIPREGHEYRVFDHKWCYRAE